MNWWIAAAIFLMSVGDDCLAVWYLRRVVQGHKVRSAILSGLLTGLISLEVVLYVSENIYILFNCAGSVLGTWIALYLDEGLRPPRTKDGRYATRPPRLTWWLDKLQ